MTLAIPYHLTERRSQILDAAFRCFSRKGFHICTMQDISTEAGISVGLIYRYFENKNAVIGAMADEHMREISGILERARQAPTLREALEVLFTCHCSTEVPEDSHLHAAFVLDLFAEAARNEYVANLVRQVCNVMTTGLTALIANSREVTALVEKGTPFDSHRAAEMILAVHDGMMMRAALTPPPVDSAAIQADQLRAVGEILTILFKS